MNRSNVLFRVGIGLHVVSALLLAGHFLRSGQTLASVACLAAPLLLAWRRRVSLTCLQLFSYAGAAIWLSTAFEIIQRRIALGHPWKTAAIILGAVALLSLVGGLSLRHPSFVTRYPERGN